MKTKIIKRLLASVIIISLFSNTVFSATWYVDTNTDTDLNTCVAGETDNDNDCSLRDAVSQAASGDTIRFLESMAPGQATTAIAFGFSSSALTIANTNVTVDGQTDGYTIGLDAQNAGTYSAFYLDGDNSTLKGLNMYNNFNNTVQVAGTGISLLNNKIGVQPDGTASTYQPSSHGILFATGYSDVTITGNTIGGAGGQCIYTPSSTSNLNISNNYIGITSGGTDVGCGQNGIWTGGGGVTIDSNVISNNDYNGIRLDAEGAGTNNTISNNKIGTNVAGTAAAANSRSGILISGNSGSGTTTISGNTLSGNTYDGIRFENSGTLNRTWKIKNNKIGTNTAGTAKVANGKKGIYADYNSSNTATYVIGTDGDGTSDSTEGNVISGNTEGGIGIYDGSSITIAGNKIGTNAAGDAVIVNDNGSTDWDNVFMDPVTTMVIGTNNNGVSDSLEGNLIAGSQGWGINVSGGSSLTTNNSLTIAGNAIGGKADGSGGTTFGNQGGAIEINSSDLTTVNIGLVGTTAVADGRNIITNNCGGIRVRGVEDNGSAATVNIRNNYIGVQSDGVTTAANNSACATLNFTDGIIAAMDYGTVGALTIGTDAASPDVNEGNIIANGTDDGIQVGNGITTAKIAGNKIGLGSDDSDKGNAASGIEINATGATLSSVTIGGDNSAEKNVIGSNGDSINIVDAGSTPASVTINNNYIGIGSDGATGRANDSGNQVKIADGAAIAITGNLIASSSGTAVYITGGTSVTFTGNKVGVGSSGITINSNSGYGLQVNASTVTSVTIGGATTALANVFASNSLGGIYIQNLASSSSTLTIKGNYIGVCANPATPSIATGAFYITNCKNFGDGINIAKGAVTIGGSNSLGDSGTGALADANVISNNLGDGIELSSSVGSATILGNVIGLIRADGGAFGTAAGNGGDGVKFSSSAGTLSIGNSAASGRNVIAGNGANGINLTAATAATIRGNYIGLGANGSTAIANTTKSIKATSTSGSIASLTIGGSTSGQENKILNNTAVGVVLDDVTPSNESTMTTDNTYTSTTGPFNESSSTFYYWARYVASTLTAYGPAKCQDGIDNDSDGLTDLSDSGCSSATDNDETNTATSSSTSGSSGSPVSLITVSVVSQPVVDQTAVVDHETVDVQQVQAEIEGGDEDQPVVDTPDDLPNDDVDTQPALVIIENPVVIPNAVLKEKLRQAVSSVIQEVFEYETIENLDLLMKVYDSSQTKSLLDESLVQRTLEQAVLDDYIDELASGNVGSTRAVRSVIENSISGAISTSVLSGPGLGGVGGALEINIKGKKKKLDTKTQIVFESSSAKAKELQAQADGIGANILVLGLSDDINDNGIADVIEVNEGIFSFKKPLVSINDISFHGADLSRIDDYKDIKDILPKYVKITNLNGDLVEVGPQIVLWVSGQNVDQEYEIFVVDPAIIDEKSKLPRQIHAGGANIGLNNRSTFDLDFTDPEYELNIGEQLKEVYIVIQDDSGHGELYRVKVNPALEGISGVSLEGGVLHVLDDFAAPDEAGGRTLQAPDPTGERSLEAPDPTGGVTAPDPTGGVTAPDPTGGVSVQAPDPTGGTPISNTGFGYSLMMMGGAVMVEGATTEEQSYDEEGDVFDSLYTAIINVQGADPTGGRSLDGADPTGGVKVLGADPTGGKTLQAPDPTGGKTAYDYVMGYATPGSKVNMTWRSIVRSSVVLADADGYFEIAVPKELENGNHEALVYLESKKKKTIGKVSKIKFKK